MATPREMDSGCLKGAGSLIEVKNNRKAHLRLDYWPSNRGGHLIGGCLISVQLYFHCMPEMDNRHSI